MLHVSVVDYPQIMSLAKPKLVFHYTTFYSSHGNYPVEVVIVHSGNIHLIVFFLLVVAQQGLFVVL